MNYSPATTRRSAFIPCHPEIPLYDVDDSRYVDLTDARGGESLVGLYFVCCNSPAYRRELVEKIKAEYALPILEFDLTGHDGETYIDHRLLTWAKDQLAVAPVFLYGLETLLPTRDEDRQFRTIQEINWRRNVYSQLGRNLVIWLPEYALTLLARQASDFYDWHSAVFEFPVPDAEKSRFVKQSMLGFMDGETHAANRMTLAEKRRWISVLNGLLEETPEERCSA